jgi:hypothetical protein
MLWPSGAQALGCLWHPAVLPHLRSQGIVDAL